MSKTVEELQKEKLEIEIRMLKKEEARRLKEEEKEKRLEEERCYYAREHNLWKRSVRQIEGKFRADGELSRAKKYRKKHPQVFGPQN